MHTDLNNPEELDALVELWVATPQGEKLWGIMWKWANTCDNWMMGEIWFKAMKKHFVQVMQWHLSMTISEDEESCSVSDALQ